MDIIDVSNSTYGNDNDTICPPKERNDKFHISFGINYSNPRVNPLYHLDRNIKIQASKPEKRIFRV